ncbi:MAG: hypothetical protein GY787_20565 [Alteromonadales bacterium]|nr:hypothetical protein [Alteromonadales bacterium]
MKKSNLLLLSAAMIASSSAIANTHTVNTYEVTVTNLTKNINFTPVMIAAHETKVNFFEVGQPASAAVERVAEGGDTSQIAAMYTGTNDQVLNTQGLLSGGQSATVSFDSNLKAPRISIASMLLPTNDAFAAKESIKLPKGKNKKTFFIRAYDAGTEVNDELCSSIPGPTCGGIPFSDPDSSDEGYIYIHNGIHGIGDLSASQYTWNNPVLKVTIIRTTP